MSAPEAMRPAADETACEPLGIDQPAELINSNANEDYSEIQDKPLPPAEVTAAKTNIMAVAGWPLKLATLTDETRKLDQTTFIHKDIIVDNIKEFAGHHGYIEAFGEYEVEQAIGEGFSSQYLPDEPEANDTPLDEYPDHLSSIPEPVPPKPLVFVDAGQWEGREPPPREWVVQDKIPAAQVTLLTGDGGTGKTIIALQLAVAVRRGAGWLGSFVERSGPVIFFTAEEDEPEVQRRCGAILRHHGLSFADIGGLRFVCRPGEDATMGVPDPRGVIQATPVLKSLEAMAAEVCPALIVIEAIADVFAGNENDRSQVRQFIGLLRGMAIKSGAAIVLLGHPSVAGRSSGTGTSGSTAWSNSVRSHLYFTAGKAGQEGDEAPTSDFRQLEVMKSNYGPRGQTTKVRWEQGVFVLAGAQTSLERVAADAAADNVFLRLMDLKAAQGIEVGPNTGKNYAPSVLAGMNEADGYRSTALKKAMERLLSAGRIRVVRSGPPSRQKTVLVRSEGLE